MQAGARSETGNYRRRNEDRCVTDSDCGIFLVADGVGGHAGGAEASEAIGRILPAWLRRTLRCGWCDGDIIQCAVEDAVEAARQEMMRVAQADPELGQMSSTLAFAVILDRTLFLTHVGDCRAYLLHRGKLRRLTADQTFVQAAIEAGVLKSDAAHSHPWRHVVTNTIGIKPLDQPIEVEEFRLSSGDRLLLCSDGLTDGVSDHRLRELLMGFDDVHDVADALVDEALACGSKDNVTCVVVDVCNIETNDNVCHEQPVLVAT
jgi:protein phosphatase